MLVAHKILFMCKSRDNPMTILLMCVSSSFVFFAPILRSSGVGSVTPHPPESLCLSATTFPPGTHTRKKEFDKQYCNVR